MYRKIFTHVDMSIVLLFYDIFRSLFLPNPLKIIYQGVNAKEFYLLLYSIALRAFSLSPLETDLISYSTN